MRIRFFAKRYCRCLTFFGWLVLLLLAVLFFRIWMGTVCHWLSLDRPVKAKTLVVEGWIEDYALKNAVNFYKKNHYKHLIVTGLPITRWHDYVTFKNTAQGSAAVMKGDGFRDTIYQAVIPRSVTLNRTYNTAVATRMLFQKHPEFGRSFNIYSVGVHARRTHLMFERAFGDGYKIGIIADTDRSFDPEHWWRSSKGFRNVSNEFVAFNYVWIFFHPDYKVYERQLKKGLYVDSIRRLRRKTDRELKDTLGKPAGRVFRHIAWFPVRLDYRVPAVFVVDANRKVFKMATNTSRKLLYRTYGYLKFRVHDTLCRLTAYQSMENIHGLINKKELFVPFCDKTNGKETYVDGRYLNIKIPRSDHTIIDFNIAYNPYCAYVHHWLCPLVPPGNQLNVSIFAGQKN